MSRIKLGTSRALDAILRSVMEQGWRLERTGKNHIKAFSPDGKTIVLVSGTPSDHRSLSAIKCQLRRGGARV